VLKNGKFEMALVNTYFDFDDYVDPVNQYIDSSYFWDLLPGFRKKTDIFIKKNSVSLIDDVIQLFTEKNSNFYQVTQSKESLELEDTTDGKIVDVFFRLDDNYDNYEREVFSFWSFLGQVGGLYESLNII
jgi:hypothetical protein